MSTGLILGAVGAAVLGPLGAGLVTAGTGFVIGSTIGNLVDAPDGPSPGDLSAPDIQEGHQLVRPYGTVMLTVHPVSVSDYTATANETGGKGGPPEGSAGYTYTLDVLGVIAQRVPSMPVEAILRILVNKKLVETRRADSTNASLVNSAGAEWCTSCTLYPGGSSQTPPPEYETRVGTANASAYRNCAIVEIIGLQCGSSKTPPLVEIEVATNATGTFTATGPGGFIGSTQGQGYAPTMPPGIQAGDCIVMQVAAANENDAPVFTSGWDDVQVFGVQDGSLNALLSCYVRTATGSAADDAASFTIAGATTDPAVIWTVIVLRGVVDIRFPGSFAGAGADYNTASEVGGNANPGQIIKPVSGEQFVIASAILFPSSDAGASFTGVPAGYTEVCNQTVAAFTTWRLRFNVAINAAVTGTTENPSQFGDGNGAMGSGGSCVATFGVTFSSSGAATGITPGLVDLQDIVDAELAMNSAISAADHDTTDLAGVTVRGFKATGPAGKTVAELGEIFYFDCVPGAPIRYQLRGTSTVATILNADTGAGVNEAGEPFAGLKIANDLERASVVGLSAPNASADHEPVFRRGDRLTTQGPDLRKVRTEVELTPAEVQGRALAMTLMERASSQTAEFGLSDKYAAAEPGDVYSAYDDQGNLYSLMIRGLTYADGVRQTRWELNDTSALVETGITDGNYTPSLIVVAPVDSNLVAIDGPILQDADDDPGAYTAIEGEGTASYPGGIVRRSVDDLDFSEVAATHSAESVVGVASTALGNWTGGYVWDELNSVTVVVGEGQSLASSTETAMQANRAINVAYFGAHGRWEVIRFRTATLGAALTYTLTGLLRGMRGTERHMNTHVIGDTFVLATTAGLRRMTGEVATMGATRYLKAVTNGRPAASAASEAFVNTAEGLRAFSPTDLMASRDGSANITFTIRHRPRLFPRYGGSGGSYIPPSSGAFSMDVYSTSGYTTVLRTLISTDGTFTYSAANQTTDFGSTQATVYTESFEVSPTYGRGSALRASA